jgi:hypothetical protein
MGHLQHCWFADIFQRLAFFGAARSVEHDSSRRRFAIVIRIVSWSLEPEMMITGGGCCWRKKKSIGRSINLAAEDGGCKVSAPHNSRLSRPLDTG